MFKIHRNNCCGIDAHKTWVFACIGITDANGRTEYQEARFSSFSKGLRDLADWLKRHACVEGRIESTGTYWMPVFNVLEKTCLLPSLTPSTQNRKRATRLIAGTRSGYAT